MPLAFHHFAFTGVIPTGQVNLLLIYQSASSFRGKDCETARLHKMSNSNSWGKHGSKSRVICLYCEEDCRKDNLKRHTSSKHKGQPPKSKLKSIGGQKNLTFFTPNSSQNENGTLFPSETSLDELNESTNLNIFDSNNDSVEIPTQSLSGKHVQEFESGSKGKKRKADETKPSLTEDDLTQHLNACEVSMKEFITEKFESMSKSNVVDTSKDKFSNSSILDRILRDASNRCRSVAEVKEVIEPDFQFDYESSQVYCQLCVQDSRPARSIPDHRSGVFNVNYSNYVFAVASMQKQPPSLLRLKAHIVEHIHESQTHKTLLEKRAFDNEKEKERQLRAYKIGMNIGRIRYKQWHKARKKLLRF